MRQFALFCVAGRLAFIVDAGVVQLMTSVLHADPYSARLLSFLCAVTTTWWFNHRYTFADAAGNGLSWQWLRYLGTQLGGFSVNYAVYALMLGMLPLVHRWPVIGVAAGSITGQVVNFALARRLVFRAGRHQA